MPGFRIAIIPVTAFAQNCTVLFDEESREAVVFDPGGEPERILDLLARQGLELTRILLTHGHLDHAGGATALKGVVNQQHEAAGKSPIEIWGPDERDRFLLEQIEEQQTLLGLSGMANATPDRWLAEGDAVAFGSLGFDVIHCPGHTPGSVVYVEKNAKLALVGDVLFRGSVGRTDFPYGDHAALINSITSKLLPLGDDISFIPGHGQGSTFGEERRSNPFLR
jgi:glyoxylase-like metal-dependent hydrolase (beta-lactamase superfamily II)